MKLSDLTLLQWIGIILLFNGTLIGGSNYLSDLFISGTAVKAIIAVASLGNIFLGGLVTMFSSQGSMVKTVAAMPGVDSIAVNSLANKTLAQLATSGSPDAAKVEATAAAQAAVTQTARAIAILLAIIISATLFAFSGSAQAQGIKVRAPAAKSTAQADPLKTLMDEIAAKKAEFVTNVVAAVQEADDDAATLTNPSDPTSFRDPIAHACYPAQIKFLQSLPQVQAIKAQAPYDVIVLFQRKRDLIAQIKAGLPGYLKVGCAALLQDERTILVQTLGLIGVTVGAGALTGVFPAAAPITLPALTLG
ncbi:hypothetical protein H8A95_39240 [Bradyrhizobium sp. Pear76]|uniref:hypothetical protein n=1 Tax=Bradyrhizobium oropedii TaxID=1571201 RepID=UPI001E4A436C|nr:hypothetical protein [Bradyrhizobium oropedii]MCC8968183.1 hypothetical protein [Bradyrhizobium oropedii]